MGTIERNAILLNGEWQDSAGEDVTTIISPAAEEPVATVPSGSAADVDGASTAAAAALVGWSQSSNAERAEVLTQIARRSRCGSHVGVQIATAMGASTTVINNMEQQMGDALQTGAAGFRTTKDPGRMTSLQARSI